MPRQFTLLDAIVATVAGAAISMIVNAQRRAGTNTQAQKPPSARTPLINPYVAPKEVELVASRLAEIRQRAQNIRKLAQEQGDWYLGIYAIHLEDEADAIEEDFERLKEGGS
jgi:hypothetical protein